MLLWDLTERIPKFLGDETEYGIILAYLNKLTDKLLQEGMEGNVERKVLSYFVQGQSSLIQAEKAFFDKQMDVAQEHFDEARRKLTLFLNSRGNRNDLVDFLAKQYLRRVEGMLFITKAAIIDDSLAKMSFYSEGLKRFNEEVTNYTQRAETYPAYVAFSRASFAEGLYWFYRGETERSRSTASAKRSLMKSRGSFRKAAFIDRRFAPYLEAASEELDLLTQERIITKADETWTKSLLAIDKGNYDEALKLSKRAKTLYTRAAELSSDVSKKRILIATSTILDAAYYEALGNLAFRELNQLEKARKHFIKAETTADKALGMVGNFGSVALKAGFEAERTYYKAMTILIEGIIMFDNQKYEEAEKLFIKAMETFKSAENFAKKGENDIILQFCHQAINDCRGYLELCNILAQ